jgi:hexulose-6-phosphate isomerase
MASINRREFLAASAAGLALAAAGGARAEEAPAFKTTLKKALIVGKPAADALKKLKDAGYDGVETNAADLPPAEAEACRKEAEKAGMRIHSVLRGWMAFNSDDPKAVADSIAKVEASLRAAKGYGADAVLMVPCRIGGMAMPEAWDFDIAFDPATGHLTRVSAGDNAKFADYIAAHNKATDASVECVKKLIAAAEETGVVIALENVWNNLWVKPDVFAHFVKRFESKWVKAYFDIGNHVKYAPPQDFIRAMGPGMISKCHVKDFKLNDDGRGGKFCNIRDGSVNWPVVRKALDDVGYSDFMTIEGGDCSPEEHSRRLDLIFAGK